MSHDPERRAAADDAGGHDGPVAPDDASEADARRLAATLYQERLPQISHYVDILINRGITWGLLGPREGGRVWDRHVLNSIAIAELLPRGAAVADVGSGAGLPGIPLAILRPDLTVTCIESLQRRATFLTRAIDELELARRVRVVRARAEDFPTADPQRFDVVTSRALAPLARLAGWCAPLLGPAGAIVAIKGRSANDELTRDRDAVARLGLSADVVSCRPGGAGPTTFAVVARRH